jgi:hypothetical protein
MGLRLSGQHIPMQCQRIEAGSCGGAHRQHAQAMPTCKLGAGRRGDSSDGDVKQRIGIWAQM